MLLVIVSFFLLQNEVTVSSYGYKVSDSKVCDVVVSRNRGHMIKFHVKEIDPKCKGLVRFRQNNTTYCIPIIDGKNDILQCPVSMSKEVIVIGHFIQKHTYSGNFWT